MSEDENKGMGLEEKARIVAKAASALSFSKDNWEWLTPEAQRELGNICEGLARIEGEILSRHLAVAEPAKAEPQRPQWVDAYERDCYERLWNAARSFLVASDQDDVRVLAATHEARESLRDIVNEVYRIRRGQG